MSAAQVGSADFLSELNETDSLAALQSAHSEKSVLVFSIGSPPKSYKTSIDNFLDKRAILTSNLKEHNLPSDREISFKFHVGTETYFIKTFVKSHLNRHYFDMTSKVLQLKRRREPRYWIPKKWNQSASLQSVPCAVVDLSLSGVRFEFSGKQKVPILQRDDIVSVKFQIHKRSEIAATAIVRFVLNKPDKSAIMGLEFAKITDVQSERVASLVQDIILFGTTSKK